MWLHIQRRLDWGCESASGRPQRPAVADYSLRGPSRLDAYRPPAIHYRLRITSYECRSLTKSQKCWLIVRAGSHFCLERREAMTQPPRHRAPGSRRSPNAGLQGPAEARLYLCKASRRRCRSRSLAGRVNASVSIGFGYRCCGRRWEAALSTPLPSWRRNMCGASHQIGRMASFRFCPATFVYRASNVGAVIPSREAPGNRARLLSASVPRSSFVWLGRAAASKRPSAATSPSAISSSAGGSCFLVKPTGWRCSDPRAYRWSRLLSWWRSRGAELLSGRMKVAHG